MKKLTCWMEDPVVDKLILNGKIKIVFFSFYV